MNTDRNINTLTNTHARTYIETHIDEERRHSKDWGEPGACACAQDRLAWMSTRMSIDSD
jgi:hypothetical protein